MVKKLLRYTTGILCMLYSATVVQAQEFEKLGQSGLEFLSVVSDARAAALGQAVTSIDLASGSLFFNPAGMAHTNTLVEFSASYNQWIADINHHAVSIAVRPADGEYGVIGASLQFVDYGEILGTIVANNDQGYLDIGNVSASAFALGVGYAKALSEQFSVGGQVRWVTQSLGESGVPVTDSTTTKVKNEVTPLAFDFGTMFRTGIKSLTFAMSVRNFSEEIQFQQEGFQLPLLFSLGISMDAMDVIDESSDMSLLVSVDAIHPRSHPEQVLMGVEWTVLGAVSFRGGYITGEDEGGVKFGFGLSQFGLQIDYAYAPFGVFDNVQQFTFRFAY